MSVEEKDFLRARRAYLRPEQKAIYNSLLEKLPTMTETQKKEFDK
jgi:hypothetical protein